MRYCPVSSVTPVRTLVMSAGLDASMVTPGSTAPEVSRTVPARLCALARLGNTKRLAITTSNRISSRFMSENPPQPLVTRGALDSVCCNDCADYGPFDHGCQGR